MKTTFTCTLTLLLLTVLNFAPADAQQYVHTQTLTGHTRSAYSIAFKDDTTLISGRTDDTVRAWNVSTGTQIWERDVGDFVYAVAVPAHSPFYVAYGGYSNHDIRFRYTDTGNWRGSLTGHTGAVLGLAFKPGQHLLASASFDDTIRIWNTADKTKLRHVRTLRGHTHDVYSVAWSPDGTTLASGSSDGTVRLWNPNNGINFAILRGHKSAVYSIA